MKNIAIWGASSGLGAAMSDYYFEQGRSPIRHPLKWTEEADPYHAYSKPHPWGSNTCFSELFQRRHRPTQARPRYQAVQESCQQTETQA